MHDLINDLAQSVAGEICFRIEGDKQISKHARHLSYVGGRFDGIKKFKGINEAQHLRTFLPFRLSNYGSCCLTNDVLTHLLPNLRCLRVLSLSRYRIAELSDDFFEDLKHLRYLDFSRTSLKCLPESINKLYNLETLLLRDCWCLKKLPSEMENLVNLCYLDISGAYELECISSNFGTLSDLQILSVSNFDLHVGKGCHIGKLYGLSNLKGQLCLSGLENVVETQDAQKAKLQDMSGLNKLVLKWSKDFENRTREIEKKVLDSLQPSKEIKELALGYYCGERLAKWIGDSSFSKLLSLCLEHCPNCISLPSIGHFPLLKKVSIKRLDRVTNVGVEFFGKDVQNAFPSLEILKFEGMLNWENWNIYLVDEEARKFPSLRELYIVECPKLLGSIPECHPSLEKLVISKCEKLVILIQSFPMLSELEIEGCQKVVLGSLKSYADNRSLKRISFSEIPKFTWTEEWLMLESIKVESLHIRDCEELCSFRENNRGLLTQSMSLGELSIRKCSQLVSIGAEEEREELMQLKIPCSIQHLRIEDFERLEKLSTTLHYVTSLTVLELHNCPSLISLSKNNLPLNLKILNIHNCGKLRCLLEEGENVDITNACLLEQLDISDCPSLISLSKNNLPSNLKILRIAGCERLRCLLEGGGNVDISNACLLEQLSIYSCPFLISLSKNNLPLNLKFLTIQDCERLRCLLEEGENVDFSNACLLEQLDIDHCPSLVSLSSRGELPTRLKELKIRECSKLESIAQEIQDNSSLESISISYSNIKYLPQGLNKLRHLRSMIIWFCSNLVSFPECGLPSSNLQKLRLVSCGKLQALPHGIHHLNCLEELEIRDCSSVTSFPEEGIPTNLRQLYIRGPNICKPLIEWGLHRLTSLKSLSISNGCPDAVSFPQEETGLILPSSLTSLSISNFPKLEILCSKGFQGLTSLERLDIYGCPSLKSLPKKDMLSSLLELRICHCPVQKEPEWSNIAHVPCTVIQDVAV